jgi:hypothetical protein
LPGGAEGSEPRHNDSPAAEGTRPAIRAGRQGGRHRTDSRDITVRLVAGGRDPGTTAGEIVSVTDLAAATCDASIEQAVQLMRDRAVRGRLPAADQDRPVGGGSLGGPWNGTRALPWPTFQPPKATSDADGV